MITIVRSTPKVANVKPGATTGRISDSLVSKPPEKRIIHKAIVPMAWAEPTLSMYPTPSSLMSFPKPSGPKSIPTAKNRKRAGIPNL